MIYFIQRYLARPRHPPKTIILESAVMQVLSTAGSKALFKREQPL